MTTQTFRNRTEAAVADLIAGRWQGESDAEWCYRVRALVEMAKRDRPLCTAVLANRMRCGADFGHGGRHDWINLGDSL